MQHGSAFAGRSIPGTGTPYPRIPHLQRETGARRHGGLRDHHQPPLRWESTARVGGNLGQDVLFAIDATHTFARVVSTGSLMS